MSAPTTDRPDGPEAYSPVDSSTTAPEPDGIVDDFDEAVVPDNARRSNTSMLLIWATLQASVSVMFTGFLARSQGLSLGQLLAACAIATGGILVYGLLAGNLGAVTGQPHSLLARTIFGRIGSSVVSVLLIIMGLGWYGFQARFLVEMLGGLFSISHISLWAAVAAILMTFNNIFGFRGVAAYARYIAAPILLAWGAYVLVKGFATVPSGQMFAAPHVPMATTVMVVVGLLVGSAAWGNEPDIFRFSRTKPWWNVPALAGGYVIGVFLFPVAGYLIAELSSANDLAPFVRYLVDFSLFGVTAFAVILLVVNQFALNDGNLYEGVNALQNLMAKVRGWRRIYSVLVLGGLGAFLAVIMQSLEENFFIVAGISATFVPCATVIMAMDVFVLPRLMSARRPVHQVTSWHLASAANWAGLAALAIGGGAGAYMGGLIPGLDGFGHTNIGFPALQAWIISAVVYVVLALLCPASRRTAILGFPHAAQAAGVAGVADLTAATVE
jgi:purine-cytosine permease-like protein